MSRGVYLAVLNVFLLAVVAPAQAGEGEPRGLRFRVHGGTQPYLEFGQSLEFARELRPEGSSARLIKGCAAVKPEARQVEGCTIGYGWKADFGDAEGWFSDYEFETVLYFFEGRFFKYDITFKSEAASALTTALEAALGPPTGRDDSPVVNAMGATFDQLIVSWLQDSSAVILVKRDHDLTRGRMSVTYLPIGVETPQPPKLKAPF